MANPVGNSREDDDEEDDDSAAVGKDSLELLSQGSTLIQRRNQ